MTIFEQNYIKMLPLIEACANNVVRDTNYIKIYNGSLMPLVVEYLRDEDGAKIYCMAHNYVQEGDLMADPDMEIAVFHELKMVEARTFQQDPDRYDQVYQYDRDGNKVSFSPYLKHSLNIFLRNWLDNIKNSGYLDNLKGNAIYANM